MKIGIHPTKGSFSDYWILYCETNKINYKLVDCYRTDIIMQLSDCNALMWHFSQNNPKAILFAKQLIYSVEASGRHVFPDFNTVWHFDDKVGQKYLLEAVNAPLIPTWVFYEKQDALEWVKRTNFPKVFKLRGGAASQNVRLAHTKNEANRFIFKAFSCGFPAYYAKGSLKERYRLYRLGRTNFVDLLEGVIRFVIPPPYARIKRREKGYVYFQEYIADCDHDIRVIIIHERAFCIKRMVRKNDFRASGSGILHFEHELFSKELIKLAFEITTKIKAQSLALDFIYKDKQALLVEISFGFPTKNFIEGCQGFWDKDLNWYEGKFNPYGWMVDLMIK